MAILIIAYGNSKARLSLYGMDWSFATSPMHVDK